MRLADNQIQATKEIVHRFAPDAEIILFGSRVDDAKRGGDIDLLIKSDRIGLADRRLIKLALMDRLGPQKIDIVLAGEKTKAFVRIAEHEGVRL